MASPVKTLENRVRAIIEARDEGRWPITAAVLGLLARLYAAAVSIRVRLYARGMLKQKRLPCKVIAVGNLTAGGTGKTPMIIYLAAFLRQRGYRVAVISRGYKGKAQKGAAIVSDGRQVLLQADDAGDEPVMMAQHLKEVPVVVGGDRVAAGNLAASAFHPQVILCDDAFQHLRLARDIDLLLLDWAHPFGNGQLLPRGMLREPVAAMHRADALIMTRCGEGPGVSLAAPVSWPDDRPVFFTRHAPYVHHVISRQGAGTNIDVGSLRGNAVYAFSAIAGNQRFRESLEQAGCTLAGYSEFSDHHAYTESDIAGICRAAAQCRAQMLVTTEKDFVRIAHRPEWPLDLVVMGIRIVFVGHADDFETFILKRL